MPASLGVGGAGLILCLPLAHRSSLGFYPLGGRYTFGGPAGGWEISSQGLMYEFHATENLSISLLGPVEVDWIVKTPWQNFGEARTARLVSAALGASACTAAIAACNV